MKKTKILAIILVVSLISFSGYNDYQSTEKSCTQKGIIVPLHPGSGLNLMVEIKSNSFLDPIFGKKIIYIETIETWSGTEERFYEHNNEMGEIIETPEWMQSIGLQKSIYRFWDRGNYTVNNKEIRNSQFVQVFTITLLRLLIDLSIISFCVFLWKRK